MRKKFKNLKGVQYLLTVVDGKGDLISASGSTYPKYLVTEDNKPIYKNNNNSLSAAVDYFITYPFIYVRESQVKSSEENINIAFIQ